MKPEQDEIERIDRAFMWAKLAKADITLTLHRLNEVSHQLDVERAKPEADLVLEAMRNSGKAQMGKTRDIVLYNRLLATQKAIHIYLGELEEAYSVARGEFRLAVFDAMKMALTRAAVAYEARCAATLQSWEELVSIDKWLQENGSRGELPGNFVTETRLPSAYPGKADYLDGRRTTLVRAGTSDILTDQQAIDIFHGVVEIDAPEAEAVIAQYQRYRDKDGRIGA